MREVIERQQEAQAPIDVSHPAAFFADAQPVEGAEAFAGDQSHSGETDQRARLELVLSPAGQLEQVLAPGGGGERFEAIGESDLQSGAKGAVAEEAADRRTGKACSEQQALVAVTDVCGWKLPDQPVEPLAHRDGFRQRAGRAECGAKADLSAEFRPRELVELGIEQGIGGVRIHAQAGSEFAPRPVVADVAEQQPLALLARGRKRLFRIAFFLVLRSGSFPPLADGIAQDRAPPAGPRATCGEPAGRCPKADR